LRPMGTLMFMIHVLGFLVLLLNSAFRSRLSLYRLTDGSGPL